jgi:5-methylthioadenosine/S-adenosylhomocysteine deaminase
VVSQLVYAAGGADVRDVIIDGRIVMKDRKLLTLDEKEILKQIHEIRDNVLKRTSH